MERTENAVERVEDDNSRRRRRRGWDRTARKRESDLTRSHRREEEGVSERKKERKKERERERDYIYVLLCRFLIGYRTLPLSLVV